MHVDAGRLDKRVQFLAKVQKLNASGEVIEERLDVMRECWAQFSQTSGSELVKAGAEMGEAKVRFLVRYHPRVLDRRQIVRYDGRDYQVEYVNTYGDRGQYAEIWCSRRTGEGEV